MMGRRSGEVQMNVSGMSGERQINLNLSLTLVDVKLVIHENYNKETSRVEARQRVPICVYV